MAEYALILGGIAILVIAGILILGPAVRDLFKSTGSSVQNFPTLVTDDRCRRAAVSRGGTNRPPDRRPLSFEDRDKS